MVTRQTDREWLCFACTWCGNTWTAGYDVAHVEDGHGHVQDYYSRDGIGCANPTAPGVVLCPACGHGRVLVTVAPARSGPPEDASPLDRPVGAGRVAA